MSEATHTERDAHVRRPAVPPRQEDRSAHPLLRVQEEAGNRAATHLARLQRHALDPEQEAGED
jgi:hypothetical protein